MSDITPGYLKLPEAAAYLRSKPGTLRKWIKTKRLPYHKPGKALLFRVKELDAWMNRYRKGATGSELYPLNRAV